MSPEQAAGDPLVDGRSDVYSLAAVCYEMLTSRPPHVGVDTASTLAKARSAPAESICVTRPDTPYRVDAVVRRALAKQPDDRYPTARAFAMRFLRRPSA